MVCTSSLDATNFSLSPCSYTKPKGQLPDYSAPVVLQLGRSSIEDLCNNLHKSIMKEFKQSVHPYSLSLPSLFTLFLFSSLLGVKSVVFHSALVWGSSVKHNPQKVGKEHVLNDEDVVQIVKK